MTKKKPISELTDRELVKRVFPKPVRDELKKVVAELNEPTKHRKQASKAKNR